MRKLKVFVATLLVMVMCFSVMGVLAEEASSTLDSNLVTLAKKYDKDYKNYEKSKEYEDAYALMAMEQSLEQLKEELNQETVKALAEQKDLTEKVAAAADGDKADLQEKLDKVSSDIQFVKDIFKNLKQELDAFKDKDPAENPEESTEEPGESTEEPGESTEQPGESTEQPGESTEQPKTLEGLKAEVKTLKEKLATLNNELKELIEKQEEVAGDPFEGEKLNTQIQAKKQEITATETAIKGAEDQIVKLEKELQEEADREAALEKELKELEALMREHKEKQAAEFNESVQKAIADAKKAVAEKSEALKVAESELAALVEKADEYAGRFDQEAIDYNNQVKAKKAEVDALAEDLQAAEGQLAFAEELAAAVTDRKVDYTYAIKVLVSQNEKKLEELIAKQNTVEDWDAKVKLNEEIQKTKDNVAQLKAIFAEAKELEVAIEKTNAHYKDLTKKFEELIRLQSVETDYDKLVELNAQIQAMKAELEAVAKDIVDKNDALAALYKKALDLLNPTVVDPTQPTEPTETQPVPTAPGNEVTQPTTTAVVGPVTEATTTAAGQYDTVQPGSDNQQQPHNNLPKTGETQTGVTAAMLLVLMAGSLVIFKKKNMN